jgi:hypothetical protein
VTASFPVRSLLGHVATPPLSGGALLRGRGMVLGATFCGNVLAMIHMVAYDLKTPNDTAENYELIIGAIKSEFRTWCHIEQSVWLIDSPDTASAVRDLLKGYLHDGDVLFVAPLQRSWASWNFGDKRNEWLKHREF